MSHVEKVQLRMQMDDGMVDGKQKTKTKSYSNIKIGATNESLIQLANNLDNLSSKPVISAKKIETTVLE